MVVSVRKQVEGDFLIYLLFLSHFFHINSDHIHLFHCFPESSSTEFMQEKYFFCRIRSEKFMISQVFINISAKIMIRFITYIYSVIGFKYILTFSGYLMHIAHYTMTGKSWTIIFRYYWLASMLLKSWVAQVFISAPGNKVLFSRYCYIKSFKRRYH